MRTQEDLDTAQIPITDKRTFDPKGLWEYFSIAAPYVVIVLLEFWVYEQMTIASGLLGVKEQACQVILINFLNLNYMVASGIQSTTATVVGNQIGYGNTNKAKDYFKVVIIFGLIFFSLQTLVCFFFMENIISFITDINEMQSYASKMKFIFCLNIIPDNMAGLLRGAIKSLAI